MLVWSMLSYNAVVDPLYILQDAVLHVFHFSVRFSFHVPRGCSTNCCCKCWISSCSSWLTFALCTRFCWSHDFVLSLAASCLTLDVVFLEPQIHNLSPELLVEVTVSLIVFQRLLHPFAGLDQLWLIIAVEVLEFAHPAPLSPAAVVWFASPCSLPQLALWCSLVYSSPELAAHCCHTKELYSNQLDNSRALELRACWPHWSSDSGNGKKTVGEVDEANVWLATFNLKNRYIYSSSWGSQIFHLLTTRAMIWK